jgi:arabinofuranan 3-O-arabinosyltransferase
MNVLERNVATCRVAGRGARKAAALVITPLFRYLVMGIASAIAGGHTADESFEQTPDHVPVASARSRWLRIEDRIITERRLRFYGSGIILAYVLSFAWRFMHGQWIFLSNGRPRCIDFGWMWLSGKLAVSGNPDQIFDYSTFSVAQLALFGQDSCWLLARFGYPPSFLFLTYPLGFLSYRIAFVLWVLTTLFFYLKAVYAIIPRRAAVIAAAAPFFVAVNADFGHNGFITAAIMGFSLASLERRPRLSGIFLGVLTYKPHFGLLFPLALLASRNWRALANATAISIPLVIGAAIAFGPQGWSSFFHTLLARHSTLSPDATVPLALHSVFGFLRWAEASEPVSWIGHLLVAAIVAMSVCLVWAKPVPYSLKAAILCIGSVMVTPYVFFYDLCILSIAVAFLVRDGMSRGFLPGERTVMLICFAALSLVQVPIGPVVAATLLFLAGRRIVASRGFDLTFVTAATNNFETKAIGN